ncbi:LpxL/LpxP family Kdo(2)-lipid IV(A) lauroyl/palmitoleoyl acyltransferase [Pseudomaricurvus alkylphenolicus]|uniref:LpxL/LpxP family Kdo(2)-lipid IV(A) lauroyl/palmitoleoyl acyltransferase n=1 Tax=Pseudomaricurvus alkylphenolicus TaxID=1306991 RepID=UPI00141F97E8|nr:LpxL/LpxP family Kdo(2)-lipid IV(A) lauroyl/palmitoleoyl acyltransferase [Pseudomaricurvus alkylphenolicus]NIB41729.1 LpxL/LpxP family Kdo(2)-lipid IV(A) lauroyl/palmitoleoyl acyltransferase [Pseudomaricurvus alkylphenolicus]
MEKPRFHISLLHPRYSLTWLLIAGWWLIAQLPFRVQLVMGRGLGWFMYKFAKRRCLIARRNIELCFPELSPEQRDKMLRGTINSAAIALFETGISWFWPQTRLNNLFQVEGLDHLEKLEGQGALLLGLHFTTLEIAGVAINRAISIDMMYRPHKNPVYDYVQRRGRERHNPETNVIPRDDVRGTIRALKRGRIIWYAPDQDYGPKQSIFAPFFGVEAASVTATVRFAKMGKVPVIPLTHTRLPGGQGYRVTVHPPLEEFPSGDDLTDVCRVNAFFEEQIRKKPEQYLWVHRRFKTRPPGENDLYGIPKRKRKRRKARQVQSRS